jgi:hypothetical protein
MVKQQKKRQKAKTEQPESRVRIRLLWLARWVGLPVLIYFVFFCIFTWPWITHFNGWYFTDKGDGLQNVWNMWWVDKSVTQLHQLPWHTGFLHAPWGVTLLGQTLNPFNGFTGILLIHVLGLSLVQAFNVMIIFSFVVAGLTTFWLCQYLSRSYWASIVGGFIFTFSSYHFAHAVGHMQLVSLEWIPLFILLWWRFMKKPGYFLAVGSSVSLLLVLLCDYYYFLYSLLIAAFIFIYLLWSKEISWLKNKMAYLPIAAFVSISIIIVAPLPLALLHLNSHQKLEGAHNARIFSTDIFTPFIDGGLWHFSNLTHSYWRHVKAFTSESTVYLTWSLLIVFVISWLKRKNLNKNYYFWVFIALFFGIMSLGPRLHYGGHTLEIVPMPYVLLEKIVPGLKLSGVPVRMMLMTTLSLAVVASLVFAKLDLKAVKGRILLAVFVAIYALEVWPAALPLTPAALPKYVDVLQKLPAGVVLDNAAPSSSVQLLDQTKDEKPMILGYISRTPQSLEDQEGPMVAAIMTGHYDSLCANYKLRYVSTPASSPLKTTFPIIYHDKQAIIYDFKNSPGC